VVYLAFLENWGTTQKKIILFSFFIFSYEIASSKYGAKPNVNDFIALMVAILMIRQKHPSTLLVKVFTQRLISHVSKAEIDSFFIEFNYFLKETNFLYDEYVLVTNCIKFSSIFI
jgi:hypothetical protein